MQNENSYAACQIEYQMAMIHSCIKSHKDAKMEQRAIKGNFKQYNHRERTKVERIMKSCGWVKQNSKLHNDSSSSEIKLEK